MSVVPDLIFLELVLPKRNGFSALRAIRKNEATHNVPVIMITGSENAAEQFFANRIGADDFMKKPFSRSEVFARVEALLDSDRVPRRKVVSVKPPVKPAAAQSEESFVSEWGLYEPEVVTKPRENLSG